MKFVNLEVFRNVSNGITLKQDLGIGQEVFVLLTSEMVDGLCKVLKKLKHEIEIEVNPYEGGEMIDKNYFQFYETFLQTIEALPTEEQLKYFSAICRYGLFGEQPSFEGKDKAIFLQIQFAIDNQNKRRSINRENGSFGGRPKTENNRQEPNETEKKQNAEVKRNEKNRSGVNVNSRNCPPQPFSFPTLEIENLIDK